MKLLLLFIYTNRYMNTCLFVSDLHGKMSRYEALLKLIRKEKPDFVFIGGDLLPHTSAKLATDSADNNFVTDFLVRKFARLKEKMECNYPEIFLIPGNDDSRLEFESFAEGERTELWRNIHKRCVVAGKYRFYGYACVPPTPFKIKDWERYDILREVSPGCIAPSDGVFSIPPDFDPETETIQSGIRHLVKNDNLDFGIFLFHSPPFDTELDKITTGSELLPVGSKAIRNFIEEDRPYITLHGHIHESPRLTGKWKQLIGRTWSFSSAHDGPELAVISFEMHYPLSAVRRLIKT
jgi:Icc-related predicted phosphoesterase